jgi:hypothetical protein
VYYEFLSFNSKICEHCGTRLYSPVIL